MPPRPRDSAPAPTVEIEPRPVRHYRALVFQGFVLVALAAFAGLALLARTTAYFSIDLIITQAIQSVQSSWFDGLMRAVSWPGYFPQSVILIGLAAALLFALRLRWPAAMSVLAALLASVLNVLVKISIRRPRPAGDIVRVLRELAGFSFPSAHVMTYTVVFGFLGLLAYSHLPRSWQRTILLIMCGAFVLAIGPSRIYLGAHWASDVLGAYLLGGLTLVVVLRLYHWGEARQ